MAIMSAASSRRSRIRSIETKVPMSIASFDASRCPNRAFVSSGLVLKVGIVGFDRVSLAR
jgi:hypothetical protein